MAGKFKLSFNTNPGPGQYDTSSPQRQQSARVGSAQRKAPFEEAERLAAEKPGPGSYSGFRSSFENSNKGPLISGRNPEKLHLTPGPGHYNAGGEYLIGK